MSTEVSPSDHRVRGERHPNAWLTEAQVRAMRKAFTAALRANDPDITMRSLAAQYGVSEEQVRRVIARRQWRHIK